MRVCIDCPRLIPAGTRCTDCRRANARSKQRGTRKEQGYGPGHRPLRRSYQQRMDRGETFQCWRCDAPINPEHWHLGHHDADRSRYMGPECVPCNLAVNSRDRRPKRD